MALEPLFEDGDTALPALAVQYLEPIQAALSGAERARKAALERAVCAAQDPCLALSAGGIVLVANEAARRLAGPSGGLEHLGITRGAFAEVLARCRRPGKQAGLLPATGDGAALFVGHWSDEQSALLLTLVRWSWPEGLAEELRTVFGLTPREIEVLDALMDGSSLDAIARRDGRSAGTLRQQVKAIFAKIGVSGQAQLIALIAATAAAWRRTGRAAVAGSADLRYGMIERDGRRIGLRFFGRENGTPVVLIHGALFGAGDFEGERAAACEAGLSVLAVEKPGYGRTDPVRDRTDMREVVALDALAAMNRYGVDRTVVIAHDVGTAAACRLASMAASRIAGIVAAPPTPPMLGWEQTAAMPRAHRLHAWVAQRAPRLLDLMIGLGIAHVHHSGAAALPDLFFGGCDFDRKAWSQPRFESGLVGVYRLIAAQNGRGFRQDMLVTNLDWSAECATLASPVCLLHGAQSQTVSLAAVKRFAAGLPVSELYVVPDAGHTVPLTHAGMVYARAASLAQQTGLA